MPNKKITKRPKLKLVGSTTAKPRKPAAKPAKKAASKSTRSAKAAKAAPKKVAKRPAPTTGSNVFWKFLEMKEARRQAQAEQSSTATTNSASAEIRANNKHNGFARFSGPRRRAATSN